MNDEPAITQFRSQYDMNSPVLAAHWNDVVEDLHDGCPVARSEVGEGYWVFNRSEDVRRCTRDWETFSSATGFKPDRPDDMPWLYPVESDPPFHAQLRSALNPYFSPATIRTFEGAVRGHAEDLIASFVDEGEIDAVTRYANDLPARSFCISVAGMSHDDLKQLQKRLQITEVDESATRATALHNVAEYLDEYLVQRKAGPRRDDVVDAILDLEFEGFGWTEKVSTLTTLTLGGLGTTGYTLAAGLHYLGSHPEDRRRLVENPDLWPVATEEFLRFFAASPQDGRRVTRSVEVSGVQLEAGDYVVMSYGAASRDPELFDEPNQVNIERPLPNRHVAFGYGIHRCLGSHLARLEARIGLQTFLEHFPDFTVRPGFEPQYQIANTVTIDSLPLVLDGVEATSR